MGKFETLQALQSEKTGLGRLLGEIKNRPIGEYSLNLVTTPSLVDQQILASRNLVMKSMDSQLAGQLTGDIATDIIDQYSSHPLLQTGDHCELIYDPQTFLNNFLYHMGASQLDLKYLVTQQCSTPRMIQYLNPLRGPGILKLTDGDYRVFNRSKRSLIRSNVASVGEVDYIFEPEIPGIQEPLPKILQELKGSKFQSAVQAFLFTNKLIWDSLKMEKKQDLVLFDESLSSNIVANMIDDPHHPLHMLLFNPECSHVFREEIKQFIQSPECLMLKETTDFFWAKHGEALIPLRLSKNGSELTSQIEKQGFYLEYNPKSIAEALRKKNIYPNLFISMLATAVFPGNTVLGGASQYEYTPEVQKILKSTLNRLGLMTDVEINNITAENLSKMVGVVSLSHPICGEVLRMDRGTDFTQWEANLTRSTIDQSLEDYSNFEYFKFLFVSRSNKNESKI